jgi:hypothetical protein
MPRDQQARLHLRRPDLPLYVLERVGHVVVVTNQLPGRPP